MPPDHAYPNPEGKAETVILRNTRTEGPVSGRPKSAGRHVRYSDDPSPNGAGPGPVGSNPRPSCRISTQAATPGVLCGHGDSADRAARASLHRRAMARPADAELQRDYNCGLALIRASGVLEQICVNSPHPGGDPACIFEGPPPTVQCLADNPPQP